MPTIRIATVADQKRVTEVGRRTFMGAYQGLSSDHDLNKHMGRYYGEEQQLAELRDDTKTTFLVEEDGLAIGFSLLGVRPPPASVIGKAPFEIERFYMDQAWLGRGVAQQLMAATISEAETLGGETIWLLAWNQNFRAMAFYRKCGFEQVGTTPYLFGDTVEEDIVMARAIEPSP
jgi:diamine N-acetyltransferase